jgi:diguanylate cyclase (GGDEF)-like protein
MNRFTLSDFPDSAFARELGVGDVRLRFAPELESSYLREHLQRVHLRVRLWFSLTAAVALFYSLMQARQHGFGSEPFWLDTLWNLPCSALLLWVVWSPSYQRWFLPIARIAVPLRAAMTSILVAQATGPTRVEGFAGLAVSLVAMFLFAGLLYRSALIAVAAMLGGFTAAALAAGMAPAALARCDILLTVTALLVAIVSLEIERTLRRSFLERALIGQLVVRDSLTGLMNRRAFDEHLLRVWQHALRDHHTVAVLMIDIDHFKSYNDTFGHQAGDTALRAVGQLIKQHGRRPLDLCARYGGEEFAVILFDLPPAHVLAIAQRMRLGVERAEMPGLSDSNAVTISIGAAVVMPMGDRTPQGLVQLADEALYEAKAAGRNCVAFKAAGDYAELETGAFRSAAGA